MAKKLLFLFFTFFTLNIYAQYLQPIITQYFATNKSEIWS